MEIEIPDLDDLKFVEDCQICDGRGFLIEHVRIKGKRYETEEQKKTCFSCNGEKRYLTNVGDKLLWFLKAIGVPVPNPDGWRS